MFSQHFQYFTNKMFEYKQHKFSIENREEIFEPLYHLVRKHTLTTHPETKKFIDKIFKLYEKQDVKISLSTLRVIEFMDDKLLGAIMCMYQKYIVEDRWNWGDNTDKSDMDNINHQAYIINSYGIPIMTEGFPPTMEEPDQKLPFPPILEIGKLFKLFEFEEKC